MPRAEGNVVARLAVQVMPDTDGFWTELATKLDAIEKRLRPLEVGVQLDENHFVQKVQALARRAEAAARDVDIKVNVDNSAFNSLDQMQTRLDDLSDRARGSLSGVYDGDLETIRQHWSQTLDKMRRDAAKKLRWRSIMPASEGAEWSALDSFYYKRQVQGRADAMRRAFSDLGPVTFDMRPDASWADKAKGVLDGFFQKEYVGRIRWTVDEDLSDQGALRRFRDRLDREFGSTDTWKYRVEPDLAVQDGSIDAALLKLRRDIRERAFGHHEALHLDIKPNMSNRELREVGHKLRRFKNKWDDTELEFKLGLDHSSRYIAAARLAMLARDRWVRLHPLVDHKAFVVARETLAAMSGFRLAKDLTSNLWDLVKNLDKAVPLLGAVGAGLAAAAAGASTLMKHTIGISGSIVAAGQAAALLGPTLVASAGFVGYTFYQALKPIKEFVPEIEGAFRSMNDVIQHGFWEQASGNVRQLLDDLFPALNNGFSVLGRSAGRHFGRVVDSFSRILAPRMQEMFEHSAAGLDELGSHSDSLAQVFAVLGRHGSAAFERILGALGRVTDRYAAWLTEADSSGRLQQIIDRGIQSFVDFGRAVGNAGGVLGDLWRAADKAGGATMGRLADGLERVHRTTAGEAFQSGMVKFFRGMNASWSELKVNIGGSLGGFAASIADLSDRAGRLAGRVAGQFGNAVFNVFSGQGLNQGITGFFSGLSAGLSRIQGVWPQVSEGLGHLFRFMGSLGRGLGPVVGSTLGALANAVTRLEPALSRLSERLGPKFAAAIDVAAGALTPLATAFANLLDGLSRIPGALELVIGGFMAFRSISFVGSLVKAVATAFSGLKDTAASAVGALGSILPGGGGGMWSGIKEGAAAGAASLAGALPRLGAAAKVAGGAMGGLGAAASGVIGLLGGPWGAALVAGTAGVAALVSKLSEVSSEGSAVVKALDAVASGSEDAGRRLSTSASKMFNGSGFDEITNSKVLNQAAEKYRGNWRWWNKWSGGNSGHIAADISDAFDRIAEIGKSGDSVGAVEALRRLGQEFVKSGGSATEWRSTVESAAGSVDGLGDALGDAAGQFGLAATQANGIELAMGGVDLQARLAMDAVKMAGQSATEMGHALDAMAGGGDGAFDRLGRLRSAVDNVGSSMVSMAAAAVDANGQVVQSVEEVISRLGEQVDAQIQAGENMLRLAEAGFNIDFLEQLGKLPEGAQYLQQLVQLLGDSSAEGQAKLQALIDQANRVGPALQGMSWDGSAALSKLNLDSQNVFSDFKKNLDAALAAAGVDANVRVKVQAATDKDQIAQALAEVRAQFLKINDKYYINVNGKLTEVQIDPNVQIDGTEALDQNLSGLVKWFSGDDGGQGPYQNGFQFGQQFSQGVGDGAVSGAPLLPNLGQDPNSLLGFHGSMFWDTGFGHGQQYSNGLASAVPQAAASGALLSSSAKAGADSISLAPSGASAGSGFASGVGSASGAAAGAGSALAASAASAASSAVGRLAAIGAAAGAGFAAGVMSAVGRAVAAAQGMASRAVTATREILDVNSPSRVFKRIGGSVVEGFALGIRKDTGLAVAAAEGMVSRVVEAGSGARLQVLDGGRLQVDGGEQVLRVAVDPESLKGARIGLRVSDDQEFDAYVADVADGRVIEYAGMVS